ncbi:hypothetical protein J6590_042235 [Homalodisca vitripennis]|nr:hypothetical protein J6590_042235 [Homalodisca vitripennis]
MNLRNRPNAAPSTAPRSTALPSPSALPAPAPHLFQLTRPPMCFIPCTESALYADFPHLKHEIERLRHECKMLLNRCDGLDSRLLQFSYKIFTVNSSSYIYLTACDSAQWSVMCNISRYLAIMRLQYPFIPTQIFKLSLWGSLRSARANNSLKTLNF